jgi:hypothetical protein
VQNLKVAQKMRQNLKFKIAEIKNFAQKMAKIPLKLKNIKK